MAEYKEVRQFGRHKRRLETPTDEALERLHAENDRLTKALNRAQEALEDIKMYAESPYAWRCARMAQDEIDQILEGK